MTDDRPGAPGFEQAETSDVTPAVFTKLSKKNAATWTPERRQLLRDMWDRGESVKVIAEALGVTPAAIHNTRFKFKLPVRSFSPGRPSAKRVRVARPKIERVAFETSRLMDFCTRRELESQTGHDAGDWPRVVLKELIDNALDAAEEAEIAPVIGVQIDTKKGLIVVEDNGPGIPSATVAATLDYTKRVSSREAYMSPTRGAQGNALKTILAMAFVLNGTKGETLIEARGVAHQINFSVDQIRMEPAVEHHKAPCEVRSGTRFTVFWPERKRTKYDIEYGRRVTLDDSKDEILRLASDFVWVNPHLSLVLVWDGKETLNHTASNPNWTKWRPSDPTCPHWYDQPRFERYMAAHVARPVKRGRERFTVRRFLSEFRGLTGTAKQKLILDELKVSHMPLAEFFGTSKKVNHGRIGQLLTAMKRHTKKVSARDIGVIGRDHLFKMFVTEGGTPDVFNYVKTLKETDGVPRVIEFGFGPHKKALDERVPRWGVPERRLIEAINWSASLGDPFRTHLGKYGQGLGGYLTELKLSGSEPIIAILHYACPKVRYLDRGKSSIALD